MKQYAIIEPRMFVKIDKKTINYVLADLNYSILFLYDGTQVVSSYTLKYIHSYLDNFIRISRGVVVNRESIMKIRYN